MYFPKYAAEAKREDWCHVKMVLHHPLRGSVAETNNVDGVTHETWEAAYAACHSSHGDSHDFDLLGVRELDAAFDWAPFVGKYAGESDFAAYTAALGRRSSISGAAGERRRNPQRGAAAPVRHVYGTLPVRSRGGRLTRYWIVRG